MNLFVWKVFGLLAVRYLPSVVLHIFSIRIEIQERWP
jgi:hypothetical protein